MRFSRMLSLWSPGRLFIWASSAESLSSTSGDWVTEKKKWYSILNWHVFNLPWNIGWSGSNDPGIFTPSSVSAQNLKHISTSHKGSLLIKVDQTWTLFGLLAGSGLHDGSIWLARWPRTTPFYSWSYFFFFSFNRITYISFYFKGFVLWLCFFLSHLRHSYSLSM